MEEKEIIEGNRLIAEFMDVKKNVYNEDQYISADFPGAVCVDTWNLKYHSSWDWLMPVVEKIGGLANVRIHVGLCSITMRAGDALIYKKKHGVPFDEIPPYAECNTSTFIGNVWHAVIDFIQWYNTQSK